MKCLCCNKPLLKDDASGWHKSCIKRFFGTVILPELEIDNSFLQRHAEASIQKGLTVPGVQKKLSLHLSAEDGTPRLTIIDYPTGYILKPPVPEFDALPEAEQLVMTMAEAVGIPTVPHALIRCKTGFAYITKRIDRKLNKGEIIKYAMEDFCQLDQHLTEDKYRGSYERCAKIISSYSSQEGLDKTELFLRLVFSFIVGNSDMHLKNFSLIETIKHSKQYKLSPAYDLLPINVIMPADKEEFALTMNGKKANLKKADFLRFAEVCGPGKKTAERLVSSVLEKKPELLLLCAESYLPQCLKKNLSELIEERVGRLS